MLKALKQWYCGVRWVNMGQYTRRGHGWGERENTVLKEAFRVEYDSTCRRCGLKQHFVTQNMFMWVMLTAQENERKKHGYTMDSDSPGTAEHP